MPHRTVSRTQRRMEKKQAIILLVLVLAVSLVSFSLGVMVGRGGASKSVVVDSQPAAPAVAAPVASAAPPPLPGDLRAGIEVAKPEAQETAADDKPADKLTFYDTLPRGELPLGSGINLPPAPAASENAEPQPAKVEPQPTPQPVTATPAPQPVSKPAAAELPVAMAGGNYVVQIASFKDYASAGKLRERLAAKGYSLFVEKADLGSKGIWHRLYAGPYTDKSSAETVAVALKNREKLSPLVRKR